METHGSQIGVLCDIGVDTSESEDSVGPPEKLASECGTNFINTRAGTVLAGPSPLAHLKALNSQSKLALKHQKPNR